jgi:hypothetical protein
MQEHTGRTAALRGCPPWCARDHESGTHPDDQHHASVRLRVPVVAGHPAIEPDDLAAPDAVVVRLLRRTHSDLTWLEVRSEEGPGVRLVTTLESARRLLAVLHRLVVEDTD